jgi:hypothetical protein
MGIIVVLSRLYVRAIKPILLAIVICAGFARALQAQTAAADPASPPDGVEVRAGYETHRDHFRYTFANPSNIDTDFLVPHAFTQRYVANNQWVFGSARYSVHDDVMQTEFAITPERQTAGSDLDTFFDPNHDVVVSGTTGDVTLRSLRFAHWSEGRLWGLPWRVGYAFRRDRSQFLPTDRIVTHSNPPSEVRSPTFGHETTISQVHEIPIEVSRPRDVSSTWRIVPRVAVSPLILARLITKLPDKYPGQDIIFDARAIGVEGGIEMARRRGWPIVLSVHYGQTWGYRRARQFRRHSLAVGARFGF